MSSFLVGLNVFSWEINGKLETYVCHQRSFNLDHCDKNQSCSKKGIDTTTRSNEEMLLRRCVVMETRMGMIGMAGRISRLGLQRRMFRYDGIPRDSPALPIEGIFLNWKRGTDE
jgi:hypothetical protein